jgi:hypothetical protein
MFINVLGQHVSILIESSSDPSKNTDPYLAMFKCAMGSQTLIFLINLCIKCMCRYVLIIQSGYFFLKLLPVHMKEITRMYLRCVVIELCILFYIYCCQL